MTWVLYPAALLAAGALAARSRRWSVVVLGTFVALAVLGGFLIYADASSKEATMAPDVYAHVERYSPEGWVSLYALFVVPAAAFALGVGYLAGRVIRRDVRRARAARHEDATLKA